MYCTLDGIHSYFDSERTIVCALSYALPFLVAPAHRALLMEYTVHSMEYMAHLTVKNRVRTFVCPTSLMAPAHVALLPEYTALLTVNI